MLNRVVGSCILWLVLAGLGAVQAQDLCNNSNKGGFRINGDNGTDKVISCVPFIVTASNTIPGATSLGYIFDYKGEDISTVPSATTHTYTKPGRYTILQVGSSNGTNFTLCREIVVLDVTAPTATVTLCPNGKVKLALADDSITHQYDQVAIDWGEGTSYVNKGEPLEVEHTFSGAGLRIIRIYGIYFDPPSCGKGRERLLPVQIGSPQTTTATITRIEARSDGTVQVSYQGVQGAETEVMAQPEGGTYNPTGAKNNQGGSQQLTPTLDTTKPHLLKLRTLNACGDVQESNEVGTMLLTVQAENEQNVLNWNRYAPTSGFTQYQLLRDGVVIQRFTNSNTLTYTDPDVQCGEAYRYQIIAMSSTAQSLSAPVEIMAVSTQKPDAITQAIVSVEQDGSVSIIAFPPAQGQTTTYRMIFERSDNPAGPFVEVGAADNTNRYSDATALTSERSYCYRILYENACGNRSDPSEVVCTVWLSRSGATLRWTPERPFTDAVGSYFVVKYNTNGTSAESNVGTSSSYNTTPDDPEEQELTYQIRARSGSGAFLSYSNVIAYRREAALFLPDAFSPNGDNINDIFQVQGTFFDVFQMIIYNKWGEVIFTSTDPNIGWDGTIRGERAPEGNYIYKVEIKDSTGKPFVKTGAFLLLR